MSRDDAPEFPPALLAPGTLIGPWRVLDWVRGSGNGTVYRVARLGQKEALPATLKLARVPEDPRFQHERELLSRCNHPHLPRWVDSGVWLSRSGAWHPYVVTEWVDGVPLYEWARQFRPVAALQLRLLSQAALALQYLHEQGAIHGDVKGENLLVRRFDYRLFVTGCGAWLPSEAGALTPQQQPAGPAAYLSPEAWLFARRHRRSSERYRPGPADDMFALGVTACVLATGQYPRMGAPKLEALRLPRELSSARVPAAQREVILHMLAVRPEERIPPEQLPPALEAAAEDSASSSALFDGPGVEPERRLRWLSTSALGALLVRLLGVGLMLLGMRDGSWLASEAEPLLTCAGASQSQPTALGEVAASAAPLEQPPSTSQAVAEEPLPEPAEGQARPTKKGRCPHPRHVSLNGACWTRIGVSHEECDALLGQMYQGACYVPGYASSAPRPTTSGAKGPW